MELRQLRNDSAARQILEARARALAARESSAETQAGEATLTFRLGDTCYGISAQLVREVQPLDGYTPLPGTPAFVLGLVNLRGWLLAALDIRPLLALPPAPPRAGAILLIVSASGLDVALLADEVIEIRPADGNLAPALATPDGHAVAWVRGIDRALTVLIDLALLLADERLVVNDAGVDSAREQL